MNRRELITGLIGLVAAPAIVRVSSLMPVKQMMPQHLVFYESDIEPVLFQGALFWVSGPQHITFSPTAHIESFNLTTRKWGIVDRV